MILLSFTDYNVSMSPVHRSLFFDLKYLILLAPSYLPIEWDTVTENISSILRCLWQDCGSRGFTESFPFFHLRPDASDNLIFAASAVIYNLWLYYYMHFSHSPATWIVSSTIKSHRTNSTLQQVRESCHDYLMNLRLPPALGVTVV